MNRVVDTSAWIESLVKGGPNSLIRSELPDSDQWLVPTIVQLELSKWLSREATEEEAARVISYSNKCVVIDLNTSLALRAAEMSRKHKLPTADAIVYATAMELNADLLTCDAHFKGLDHVVYLPKQGG